MKSLAGALCGLLFLSAGCAAVDNSQGRSRLESTGRYLYKIVSPDGNALTVREHRNEGNSDLETWKQAVTNHLTRNKGYKLVSQAKFKTASGSPGWEALFGAEAQGLQYLYYVGIARHDKELWGIHRLYVIEAAGEKALMEKDLPKLKKAARSLRY